MHFRTGRESDRTVYFQRGKEPGDRDGLVCVATTVEGAVVIATALNQMMNKDRTPENSHARWELAELISVPTC